MKDDSVKKLFNAIKLDANLAEKDNMTNLNDRQLLKAYLKHCTKERTYFFSVKKCGEPSCTKCLPIRLPRDIFDRLYHLPDPMPSPINEGHHEQFNTCYGTETTEDHMPSKKHAHDKGMAFHFNHTNNMHLILILELFVSIVRNQDWFIQRTKYLGMTQISLKEAYLNFNLCVAQQYLN